MDNYMFAGVAPLFCFCSFLFYALIIIALFMRFGDENVALNLKSRASCHPQDVRSLLC